MTALQAFNANDELELRVRDCFLEVLNPLGVERDDFYDGAHECFVLGDVLFALKRSPIGEAVGLENFRRTFYTLHDYFQRPGTFEFYLTVFRAIWGEDVGVTFTVPSPGVLEINVEALNLDTFDLVARRIVNNVYLRDEIITQPDGDNLAVRSFLGIRTQEQFENFLTELAPAGIYVEGTLTIA